MFDINFPGKVGAVNVCCADAGVALAKLQEMEASELCGVAMLDPKGDRATAAERLNWVEGRGIFCAQRSIRPSEFHA